MRQTQNPRMPKRLPRRKPNQATPGRAPRSPAQRSVRSSSSGTYMAAVEMRARRFPDKVAGDAGFATVLLGMFLIGSWFVRSGVMENTAAHLPLFRKLALYGLPIGIGMGLLGSTIAMSHTPGDNYSGFSLPEGCPCWAICQPAWVCGTGGADVAQPFGVLHIRVRLRAHGLEQLPVAVTDLQLVLLWLWPGNWGMGRARYPGDPPGQP